MPDRGRPSISPGVGSWLGVDQLYRSRIRLEVMCKGAWHRSTHCNVSGTLPWFVIPQQLEGIPLKESEPISESLSLFLPPYSSLSLSLIFRHSLYNFPNFLLWLMVYYFDRLCLMVYYFDRVCLMVCYFNRFSTICSIIWYYIFCQTQ